VDRNQLDIAIVDEIGYLGDRNFALSNSLKYIGFDRAGQLKRFSTKEYDDDQIRLKKYQFRELNGVAGNNPTVLTSPYGENLAEVIRHNNSLWKECGELLSLYNLKFIFDKNDEIAIQKQLDEFRAFQFSFSGVADTIQRLIFYKAAISTNEKTVLLFEEPEAHMFSPYISKFTSDVVHDEGKNQFFLTTHSPFVLNDLMDNLKSDELAIYIVSYKRETGETLVHRMNEEDMHDAYQFGYDFFMNMDKFLTEKQHE
jgi:AAA15 family ATPase/GTPase